MLRLDTLKKSCNVLLFINNYFDKFPFVASTLHRSSDVQTVSGNKFKEIILSFIRLKESSVFCTKRIKMYQNTEASKVNL